MASLTQHFGFQKLEPGDPFSINGQQYTTSDRDEMDRLIYLGAIGHTHSGATPVDVTPQIAPDLTVDVSAGYLPSSTQTYYGYTYLDPNGFETALSPAAYATTADPVAVPSSPAATADTTAGANAAGGYFYVLTCYTGDDNTSETVTSTTAYVTLVATGQILLSLPSVSSGATGFNIYRQGPGDPGYYYLDSVNTDVTTPPTTYLDTGAITENYDRVAPTSDTTSGTNTITVTIPATPPAGYTWNLYRTFIVGDWTDSFLVNVTTQVDGVLTLAYDDIGLTSPGGTPPPVSQAVPSPTQINLNTDVVGVLPASTFGVLPPDNIGAYPIVVTFSFPNPLVSGDSANVWVNEFLGCEVVSCRASLGRGVTPAVNPIIVDVLKGTGSSPSYSSIFPSSSKPEIALGQQIGAATPPSVATTLAQGDSLTVSLTESDGEASPLTINLYLLVSVTSATVTGPVASAPIGAAPGFVDYVSATDGNTGNANWSVPGDVAVGDTLIWSITAVSPDGTEPITLSDTTFVSQGSQQWCGTEGTPLWSEVFMRTATADDAGSTLGASFAVVGGGGTLAAYGPTGASAVALNTTSYGVESATPDPASVGANTTTWVGPTIDLTTAAAADITVINVVFYAGASIATQGAIASATVDGLSRSNEWVEVAYLETEDVALTVPTTYPGSTVSSSESDGWAVWSIFLFPPT